MELNQSEIFTVPAKEYAKAMASRHSGMLAAAAIVPILILAIAGFYDLRWWLVGLMLLMLVYPMMLTIGWFAVTGRPSMGLLLRPQRWSFGNGNSIHISFYRFDTDKNHEPVDSENVVVDSVDYGSRYCTLRLKPGSRFDVLLIPSGIVPQAFLNAFTETE